MKIARRRAPADVRNEDPGTRVALATAPRGRTAAAYAGIFDGEALWVAVDARPGTLGLRPAGGGDVVALADGSTDDQPGYTAARLDLTGLPADAATYDVVLETAGRPAQVLWTPPLPTAATRTARDGVTRFALLRGPEGSLQVVRSTLPAAATLRSARAEQGAVHLELAGAGPLLAAVDDDGDVVASWDVVDQRSVVTVASLDDVAPRLARLVTGEPGGWRPVRRRGNELPEPGRSALLPAAFAPQGDQPRLRLRWSPQADLLLRIGAPLPEPPGAGT